MKMSKGKRKGFTLVELVIVIAVIAVLSAILIPTFANVVKNANVTKYQANVNSMNTALVTEATVNGVDYYTPSGVRQFLEANNFDLSGVPEGYSVWFDQKTFNLKLIKDEVAFGDQAVTMSKQMKASFSGGGIGSSLADKLPRRPEALTADENLLMIATSTQILNSINSFYASVSSAGLANADEPKELEGAQSDIEDAVNLLSQNLMEQGIPSSLVSSYIANFSLDNTVYINRAGYVISKASTDGKAKSSLIVSSQATKIVGLAEGWDVEEIKLDCVFEVPYYITTVEGTAFNLFGNNNVEVVIGGSCDINVGNQINVSITTLNRGEGLIADSIRYENISLESEACNVAYDRYFSVANGGLVTLATAPANDAELEQWWSNTADNLFAKYIAPTVSIDLKNSTILRNLGIEKLGDLNSISVRDQSYGDYRKLVIVATYWDRANGDPTLKGIRIDQGLGYLTNLYTYFDYADMLDVNTDSDTAAGGAVRVKLPDGVFGLDGFAQNDLKIKVYYRNKTTYYQKDSGLFVEFKKLLGSVSDEQLNTKELTIADYSNGSWSFNIAAFARIQPDNNLVAATHFVNGIELERIEVIGKDGIIKFVRYYN